MIGAVPQAGAADRDEAVEASGCGLLLPGAPQAAASKPMAITSAAPDLLGRTRRAMWISSTAWDVRRRPEVPAPLLNRVSAR
ncbi:hypothetical protein Sme01_63390 [Sphaerisporangium melleum]|uniref:Uncharacterized protein n=1 Tax=Sphaerisporangium melleum TaxID=321316 RepID=A0A917R1A7_9ACTN|nr:hypothetical protein GCM10007964_24950 [Sphaerisporangium melleum]GII73863.1 hypothetical protein Sme01_63390 [Sphaerisporangium melleum]